MEALIGTILTAMLGSGLFKKPRYWLFTRVKGTSVWLCHNCPNGNSGRQCRKAKKALLDNGYSANDIMIMPKGMTPPKE